MDGVGHRLSFQFGHIWIRSRVWMSINDSYKEFAFVKESYALHLCIETKCICITTQY
jgi:hypothetical protein